MKHKLLPFLTAIALFAAGCTNKSQTASEITINPEAGTTYKSGDAITVKLNTTIKPDSVVYALDSVRMISQKDASPITFKTDTMPLGSRLITARFYRGGSAQDISTNVVILAAKAPEEYTYKVEKVYPHDTSAYTEGLLYQDGYLYESAGNYGESDLRRVDLITGKIVQKTGKLDKKYFGEGISIIGDKIIQLTYREKIGFIYDKNTFKQIGTFSDTVGPEGWGLCFDGKRLYKDDSTNRIWFLDKNNYRPTGYIDVYDDKGPINMVNELEYINDKLYVNVYTRDTILQINPKTGAVLQRINMAGLWPNKDRPANFDYTNNVLNGIAWDEKGKRLFVTGKKWPHLYQVKFVKK